MTIPERRKERIYKILQSWQAATAELDAEIQIDHDEIRLAAAILLVGGAKSDKGVENLCGVLWAIWEEHKDAMQGMQ